MEPSPKNKDHATSQTDTTRDPTDAESQLKRFVLRADQDVAIAHCLKMIGRLRNLDAMLARFPRSLAGLVKRFNGKPILTRPEHFFHRDPANRYLEVDLDAHCYKYLTRSAVATGMKYVGQMELGYGLVVEARREQELPERMLCCAEVLRIQEAKLPRFPPPSALQR